MPDYQVPQNAAAPVSKSNPYITRHYKKDNRRTKKQQGSGNASPPLLRDLLIMQEGMKSVKGYDQLAGETPNMEPKEGKQFSPQQLELLRKAILLIQQQQGN